MTHSLPQGGPRLGARLVPKTLSMPKSVQATRLRSCTCICKVSKESVVSKVSKESVVKAHVPAYVCMYVCMYLCIYIYT